MATGTITPPALQPLQAPSAKERRYDRQLRLWAASGQKALEEAHLLLLNSGSGAVGTETLKNLVLPGMGSFTIVDPTTVKEEDLGVNFFLEDESVGKSRAEECAKYLVELNPDVKGKGVQQDFKPFFASADLSTFTLILLCGPFDINDLEALRLQAWLRSQPIVEVSCAGFYSSFSIQLPKLFPIVDTHPDPTSTQDLRLLSPWSDLVELKAQQTKGLAEMSDHDHGHVPYLLLLLFYLDQWKADHDGRPPSTYKEKTAFRDLVRAGARTANAEGGEENYDEAIAAVLKSLNEPSVPSGLRDIFAESECKEPKTDSADFWYIAHAVMRFVEENKVLPLPGAIPDMKAQSKDYIALQNTYKTKARADVANVTAKVRDLEARLRPSGDSANMPVDAKEIEAFCKGAAHVKLVRGRYRGMDESRGGHMAAQLEDGESLLPVEIAFQAMNSTLSVAIGAGEADATTLVALADQEESMSAMETFVDAFLERIRAADGAELDVVQAKIRIMLAVQELQRAGPAELHNIASLTGGMVAQEIIKVLTKQYVPIDNTCVFDGITSKSAVFRL